MTLDALLVSTGVVTLAEMGDKTQLLAFILAARFKKPIPIVLGILIATVLNHGLAGALGAWITTTLEPEMLRWALGLSFLAMAAWTLIPDHLDDDETTQGNHLGRGRSICRQTPHEMGSPRGIQRLCDHGYTDFIEN